ncbi:TPA: hypothetical protein DCW38_04380 [candidate division WOR-3 bacterium]|uniref:Water stress and hypersensitive response domain-containing protein n=1 Tax=candidate division WOR-3 bacterium TaxID=2052148 RepID=A0A350HA33_UNCW3|nr:hypothetical protein [candidate division WOR-3 bacterium]
MKAKILYLAVILILNVNCAIINQMQAIKNLDYEYDSVKAGFPSLSGMNVIVKMKVSNPNKADVTIKKISYQIFVNDIKVAEGKSEDEFKVKQKESKLYSTKIFIGFKETADFISKLSGGIDYKIEVRGDVWFKTSLGTYNFPFNVEKKVSEIGG